MTGCEGYCVSPRGTQRLSSSNMAERLSVIVYRYPVDFALYRYDDDIIATLMRAGQIHFDAARPRAPPASFLDADVDQEQDFLLGRIFLEIFSFSFFSFSCSILRQSQFSFVYHDSVSEVFKAFLSILTSKLLRHARSIVQLDDSYLGQFIFRYRVNSQRFAEDKKNLEEIFFL